MKHLVSCLVAAWFIAQPAWADCYADYKAKRDDPLRLHYGVAEVHDDCDVEAATEELTPRLADEGWQMLNVLGVFDETGLEERRDSAGEHYLRY
jgi:hypothetical protein